MLTPSDFGRIHSKGRSLFQRPFIFITEIYVLQATGQRVLKAIGEVVPVRLMKRDLLYLAERLTAMLDERKLAVLIRQHGIGKPKDTESPAKLLSAFIGKADESNLGRILFETAILLSMHNQTDAEKVLREAAQVYKVEADAITATVAGGFSLSNCVLGG